MKDHPRTCGENLKKKACLLGLLGSPPHLRGKRGLLLFSKLHFRITPAPAGKTLLYRGKTRSMKDHPRTCGENNHIFCLCFCIPGSPPHLRGKLFSFLFTPFLFRITPAPAGKTKRKRLPKRGKRDHPRTCGENTKK